MGGIGRIAFLGTGAFGVPLLSHVAGQADDLIVISQPDRPAGRRLQLRATPVTAFAREHGIPVLTPHRLRSDEAADALRTYAPDGLVLVAYGQLVPQALLDVAERPPLNVHPSLLPRHRGAAPVAGTILAGDREGGVTLMVMTAELDAGPIVQRWPVPLTGRETTPELEAALADLAAEVVPPVLEQWASGAIDQEPQDEAAATYVHPFTRDRTVGSTGNGRRSRSTGRSGRSSRGQVPGPRSTGDESTFDERAPSPASTGSRSAPCSPARRRSWRAGSAACSSRSSSPRDEPRCPRTPGDEGSAAST